MAQKEIFSSVNSLNSKFFLQSYIFCLFFLFLPLWIRILNKDPPSSWIRIQFGSGSTTKGWTVLYWIYSFKSITMGSSKLAKFSVNQSHIRKYFSMSISGSAGQVSRGKNQFGAENSTKYFTHVLGGSSQSREPWTMTRTRRKRRRWLGSTHTSHSSYWTSCTPSTPGQPGFTRYTQRQHIN